MPDAEKRLIRELKRVLKKRGNKARRLDLKRSLADDPAAAAEDSGAVTRYSTAALNGHDRDATAGRAPRRADRAGLADEDAGAAAVQ